MLSLKVYILRQSGDTFGEANQVVAGAEIKCGLCPAEGHAAATPPGRAIGGGAAAAVLNTHREKFFEIKEKPDRSLDAPLRQRQRAAINV